MQQDMERWPWGVKSGSKLCDFTGRLQKNHWGCCL